jgi:hypothetical protein
MGDRNGPIFAYWVIVFFQQCVDYILHKWRKFWAALFHGASYIPMYSFWPILGWDNFSQTPLVTLPVGKSV